MCRATFAFWENVFLHIIQGYGLSPVWTLAWVFKELCIVKALLHIVQLYRLSPEWTTKCLLRSPLSMNAFWHVAQWYGFSPVCVLQWRFKSWRVINFFLQTEHS
jgi:hypothetical protein